MKLNRLTIQNCSRVKDVDIEVRDNLVLIGPNGSGKTTVLLCMDMLLGMGAQQLGAEIAKGLIRDNSKPLVVEGVFGALTDEELAVFPEEARGRDGRSLRVRLEARASGHGGEASGHGGEASVLRYCPNAGPEKSLSPDQQEAFGWMLVRDQKSLRDLLRRGVNILAIDEPEAHQHPSSQRSLMNLLKMSPVQKIMVTHSPTIAGSFEPDEIVVLHEDGSVTQPESGFLSGDAGVVARWWVGRQLEPLTAGTVIAVEGASDRIIINRVAAVLKLDLDWYDVVVAETGGCGDMWVVEAIFGSGGFDIPLFELVDDDNRQVIANRVGADPDDPEDLAKHHVFVSDKDLEDEYIRAIGVPAFWSRIKASGAFSRRELRQCRVGRDGNPTAADLAELARRKKVPAALVAASLLDEKNAPLMGSVVRLLSAAAS